MTDDQAVPLPDDAIQAGLKAMTGYQWYGAERTPSAIVKDVLAAAADVLRAQGAATEREACAHLAEQHNATVPSGRRFADLIRAQDHAMKDYPVRQRSLNGVPKPETSIERCCKTCGASFVRSPAGRTGECGIWRDWSWYCSAECDPDDGGTP